MSYAMFLHPATRVMVCFTLPPPFQDEEAGLVVSYDLIFNFRLAADFDLFSSPSFQSLFNPRYLFSSFTPPTRGSGCD
jgi:hypothetical protein